MSGDVLRLYSGDFEAVSNAGGALVWPQVGETRQNASPARGDGQPTAVQRALIRAAQQTAVELAGDQKDVVDGLLEKLTKVAYTIIGAANGEPPGANDGPVRLRDMDSLRIGLIRNLQAEAATINTAELLATLAAMERTNCVDRRDVQSNQFTEYLAGPQALEAVVEMAHDIRSPLSSILFLVDAIRRSQSGSVTAVQERQLGLIYGAALGLSTLASDVIDAVRGDRLVDGSPVPFSVAEVMFGVRAIVRPIGEEKGLQIDMTLPHHDGRIGYPSAISRVLLNLVTNAVRYTDKGKVSIGCTEEGPDTLEFWIEDTGRGIPPGVLDTLFDGFRPWAAGMRFSNAGLGLAICRNLLTAMKSKLEVQTALEKGTRFSFRLQLPIA